MGDCTSLSAGRYDAHGREHTLPYTWPVRVVDALLPDLLALGLRPTPQRQLIYSLLAEGRNHLTVEAVYEAMHEAVLAVLPTVSLRTVYQALHDLEAMGEIRLVQTRNRLGVTRGPTDTSTPAALRADSSTTSTSTPRWSQSTNVKSNEPSERTARRKDRRV